jgi:hypothetical protein
MNDLVSRSRVRDALLICGALLLVVVTIAARKSGAGAAASTTAPALYVTGTEQQLGSVASGTVLRTQLTISNHSGRRLVINEEVCALCDADSLPTIIVGPGEMVRVNLAWDTSGISGPLELTRRFLTNDPSQPRFRVTVWGEAVGGVTDPAR